MGLLVAELLIPIDQTHYFLFPRLAFKKNHQHLITNLNLTEDAFSILSLALLTWPWEALSISPQRHAVKPA